ncbi:uncharacterized protein LOC127243441 [Andrographis paniculata]|uniref:uncharacterized protein LOC127243441 n=1 Tax=Andrographis paniculata TaxID=175694 RepID=UPI0021E7FE80|nr:uncharacterized protein LOC127243441 [Andrographis paniculata]
MAAFFSDSDEDKAVDELLSQAMDSTVLDQVAAINCAGFDSGGLPSHLEARFARLKSFPSAAAKTKPSTKSFHVSDPGDVKKIDSPISSRNSDSVPENSPTSKPKCADSKNNSPPCDSAGVNRNPRIEIGGNGRKSNSPDFWADFSTRSRSVSPPVKSGCFLCSPKKSSRKLGKKENRGLDLGLNWGKHDDDLLTDLSNFSVHSKKMSRRAMEEEEKICREAEKIVKWAKQASARMEVSGIEDILSDDDENHKFS